MIRILTIFGVIGLIGIAAGVYHVKYAVGAMQRENHILRTEIRQEHAAIRILEAEWSRLNKPERLQDLSGRLLNLKAVDASQIVGFAHLPPRIPALQNAGGDRDLVSSGPRANPLRALRPFDVAETVNTAGRK